MAEYSEKQIAKMRATIEAHEVHKAEQAAIAKAEYIRPIADLIRSDEYRTVTQSLAEIAPQYAADSLLSPHVTGLLHIAGNLAREIKRQTPDTDLA